MWRGVVLSALICAVTNGLNNESRIVYTAQGAVKGYKEDGIFQFLNIPYASAPTGPNKFKAPNPGPVWHSTLEAIRKDMEVVCPQGRSKIGVLIKNDCLLANVFVPDGINYNLPVYVIVHGGAYQIGSGSMLTPKYLVRNRNLITITFNYRLGVHGFLCLGTKDAPGNAGMKDQVALLRWVQKNIQAFGGNPNDVTIGGFSAGSSAVDLLQLSKTTRGLFHKVIPESGASIAVWSVQNDPLKQAKDYARQLNFHNVDDIYALEEFYKTTPLDILQADTFLDRYNSTYAFVPCVERDTGVERFLEDSPMNILKSRNFNRYPILYGFANMEGLYRVNFGLFDAWRNRMNEKFSDFLPADLHFTSNYEREEVALKIKQFYFGNDTVSDKTVFAYIAYFTDVMFAYPILKSIRLQVQAGNNQIYLYEYSFVDQNEFIRSPTVVRLGIRGADHCSQTFALYEIIWRDVRDESAFSERTKKMRGNMRGLWSNFIRLGSPVPRGSSFLSWPPVNVTGSPHMSLDEKMELRGQLLEERFHFWDDVYRKHYSNPIPPPAPSVDRFNQ